MLLHGTCLNTVTLIRLFAALFRLKPEVLCCKVFCIKSTYAYAISWYDLEKKIFYDDIRIVLKRSLIQYHCEDIVNISLRHFLMWLGKNLLRRHEKLKIGCENFSIQLHGTTFTYGDFDLLFCRRILGRSRKYFVMFFACDASKAVFQPSTMTVICCISIYRVWNCVKPSPIQYHWEDIINVCLCHFPDVILGKNLLCLP